MQVVSVQGLPYYKIAASNIERDLLALLKKSPNKNTVQTVTEHWTAGSYTTPYKAYQILVNPNYILVSHNITNYRLHQHTAFRNTGNIAVTYMAMANGCPVTNLQIERHALVKAILKHVYKLDWSDFKDHAHWAKVDGYWPHRWDTQLKITGGTVYSVGLSKAKWYYDKRHSQWT